jgi:hypothetical protein
MAAADGLATRKLSAQHFGKAREAAKIAEVGYASPTMLPKPSLRFTVPSLHDGLALDCRIYHPPSLAASPDAPSWQRHAAIVAHPYAPLGGCYDDPVVEIVAGTLLRLGFLVGTFNFRFGLFFASGTPLKAAAQWPADTTAVVL